MGPRDKEDEQEGIPGVDEDPETGHLIEEEDDYGLDHDYDWAGGD